MFTKILAVKALWDLCRNQVKPQLKSVIIDGKNYYQVESGREVQLKECKELVESIMRLGVRLYLADPENFKTWNGDPTTDRR